ncbi:glutathione ABC transporter ATP-binding protein [Devosia geojensis]|uniref:Glutathione import ATP-binding protein GsiA n=1 Tax=Devosia geojensis TaxID=443610 RepID=A0A0F5FUY9_9HYPH|nr:ABC transporter ATP-binding protein [Devosia geojensis]KKB12633.1 glutathione ABC transporter ATP-binding protein [Devosia geojensis]
MTDTGTASSPSLDTPGNGEPVLSVRDLKTAFRTGTGWTQIVKGISFDIGARETLAVVGESGSGKSVTALSIMRLLSPETSRIEGSVRLGGRELLTLPEAQMRMVRGGKIGMVFQEAMTSLNPLASVGDQIAEALSIHGRFTGAAAEAEAVRMLERVRIPAAKARARNLPHNLSGGMRQRVMIAMALACKPQLLIADEPTTALDVTIQAQILQLIKELQREEGMGVLFITHDMGVVAEIADRTVVMLGGEVVEQGQTEDIFAAAQSPYTKTLIAAVPRLGSMTGKGQPEHFPVVDRKTGVLRPAESRPDTVDHAGQPVLSVRNLVKRFDLTSGLFGAVHGRVHAVENVSFDLQAGETLSLVGESGCGKSTTGRAIMRLIEPQGGAISIDGTDILALDKARMRDMRRHIQMIFQDPFASLNPRIRVGEAIAEPYLTHKLGTRQEARAVVADLLERVGMDPQVANRYPQQFSGGQRQRICIARALSLSPKVIVADESVSGLDVSIKAQVVNLLLDLQQAFGLSYLFISHDMAVVERMSHRVAVMYLGEIVELGPSAAVFKNPQHPYTKRLISAVPIPDPSRRAQVRKVANDEVRSPIRPADYVPPQRSYREVSPGHVVQEWEGDWKM